MNNDTNSVSLKKYEQKVSVHATGVTDTLHQRHPSESWDPVLVPAKAGNHLLPLSLVPRVKPEDKNWIPAFAGMTPRGRIYLLALFIICASLNCKAAEPNNGPIVIQPDMISSNYQRKLRNKTDIEKGFENQFPRFEYFVQEITNFIDTESSIYFYNYINPTVPEQAFIDSNFNIYKKILLLKDIEKSPKERAALLEIQKFLDTNYKTQRIPSYAYVNNPQLPKPLYMSQLTAAAFKAVKEGNIDILHTLVNNYDLLNTKDKEKNSLLATAIAFKKNNMIKLLLAKGADVNSSNAYGMTPLMLAAKTGNYEAVNFLIKQKCDLKKRDLKGKSASDYAKESKNIDIYFLLQNSQKKRPKLRRR